MMPSRGFDLVTSACPPATNQEGSMKPRRERPMELTGELTDQVAVVTGAGQGIGKATALALASAGATVVAVDVNGDGAKETAAAITAKGQRALPIQADIGSVQDIDRMVTEVIRAFTKVDI